MRVRILALGALAVAILAGGVYLFLQVTSDPAPAVAARDDRPEVKDTAPAPDPDPGSGDTRFTPAGAGSAKSVTAVQPKVEPAASKTGSGPAVETGDDETADPDVDLDLAMDEANKLYDGNDYEAAAKQAIRVLGKKDLETKDQTRMLRIIVSSGCMMGDVDQATKYFDQLPTKDQGDMIRRCERFDIHFKPAKPKTN
jgi:hypothetical protein